jgi:CHAD domain-containing protein/CYTH domain-containing protein
MQRPAELLPLPAKHAARVIALGFLDEADAAADRLVTGSDPEALHDFRVGLRRLRSCLRAYERSLCDSVREKDIRRLRAVARATGESRDAEVHLAWLAEQRSKLPARRRIGVQWLIERTQREKAEADVELRQETTDDFERVRNRLRARLAEYGTTVRLDGGSDEPRYADVAAALIATHAGELQQRLSAVAGPADHADAHEARIAGKRLRYLLEPVTGEVAEAQAVVKRLKVLQDLLGELHDTHVFCAVISEAIADAAAEHARRLADTVLTGDGSETSVRREMRRDARPGLLALARLLREREQELFAQLHAEWLGDAGAPLFDEVRAAARAIAARGRPHVEIERKFLLTGLPESVRGAEAREIEQGYVPGERLVERLRRARSADATQCYRTVKLGSGLSRVEVEEETTAAVFDVMWPLTEGRRVQKRRYAVPDGELTWEIDEFTDRELVLAEVELPSESTPAEPPEWLRPYVAREVTGEDEYVNANLAR